MKTGVGPVTHNLQQPFHDSVTHGGRHDHGETLFIHGVLVDIVGVIVLVGDSLVVDVVGRGTQTAEPFVVDQFVTVQVVVAGHETVDFLEVAVKQNEENAEDGNECRRDSLVCEHDRQLALQLRGRQLHIDVARVVHAVLGALVHRCLERLLAARRGRGRGRQVGQGGSGGLGIG